MGDKTEVLDTNIIGNIGLFYVCYQLSKLGWIVMPTSRNTKGVDVFICSQEAKKKYTIEVKSLSGRSAVGISSPKIIADFMIICRYIFNDKPEIFIATRNLVETIIDKNEKNGNISYWLEYKVYEQFSQQWDVIGTGSDEITDK